MFKVEIKTDNAAFDGDQSVDTAAILRKIADKIEGCGNLQDGTERDYNGNTVAVFSFLNPYDKG